MWKLTCNEPENETIVKFKNIIGRGEIIDFFADNGYALMDSEMESIMDMNDGEILYFYFPNKTKYIKVVHQ